MHLLANATRYEPEPFKPLLLCPPSQVQHPSRTVRTMAVEEGHVINIDGGAANGSSQADGGSKYCPGEDDATDPLFAAADSDNKLDVGDAAGGRTGGGGGGGLRPDCDRVSVLSGVSGRSRSASETAKAELPWYKGLTWKDFKAILPTFLILVLGTALMIAVTPFAYQQVIRQLAAEAEVKAMKAAREAAEGIVAVNETALLPEKEENLLGEKASTAEGG